MAGGDQDRQPRFTLDWYTYLGAHCGRGGDETKGALVLPVDLRQDGASLEREHRDPPPAGFA